MFADLSSFTASEPDVVAGASVVSCAHRQLVGTADVVVCCVERFDFAGCYAETDWAVGFTTVVVY